ncbi:hypothetical protein PMAYCL1PPCAC_04009, partial [Pristionchus mayeri]
SLHLHSGPLLHSSSHHHIVSLHLFLLSIHPSSLIIVTSTHPLPHLHLISYPQLFSSPSSHPGPPYIQRTIVPEVTPEKDDEPDSSDSHKRQHDNDSRVDRKTAACRTTHTVPGNSAAIRVRGRVGGTGTC